MELFSFLLAFFVSTLGASTRGTYSINLEAGFFEFIHIYPLSISDHNSASQQTQSAKFRMPPPRSLSKSQLVLVNDLASKCELASIPDQ